MMPRWHDWWHRFYRTGSIVLLVAALNMVAWYVAIPRDSARPWAGTINGLTYNPYRGGESPEAGGTIIPAERIAADLSQISQVARAARTYSTTANPAQVPALAKETRLQLTVGAWISGNAEQNAKEIANLIREANQYSHISRLIVGNETLLRGDVSPQQLIAYLDEVRAATRQPVSTAEPWHIWLKYPQLVDHVDYITIHTLPYWEGVALEQAVPYVLQRYEEIKAAFPGMHVTIGEVGWPSDGQWVKGAEPSQINQAKFVRDFLNIAREQKLDFFLIEAFDQPWKASIEGTVGSHWGIWDHNAALKFPMDGAIIEVRDWYVPAIIASLVAALGISWLLWQQQHLRWRGQLFFAVLVQLVVSLLVWAIDVAVLDRLISGTVLAWAALILAQLVLLTVLLIDGFELTEVLFVRKRQRDFVPLPPDALGANPPKVSIHVPCYNEPPEMVIETLNALAALDYPNFEVLVIDNNTKDPAVWQPLAEHCQKLGPQFRFFHLPKWPGFKAGALNFGLAETAPDAAIVGVIDSDYVVSRDWLRATIPYFDKPNIGFVQAPQDYRDWPDNLFKSWCNWEYAGFFHIGMVQRNERNAIIQHGTMTLIRKQALQAVGGWAEWCICEDAELGLRFFEAGYESIYLPHSFGKGLIPDDFGAYKSQRFRWAYGAVQIIKRHIASLLPGGKSLTEGQRYHFVSGWLPWFADGANLLFALAALLWSGLLLAAWVEFPPSVFLVPALSAFIFKIIASFWLYGERLKVALPLRLGAAIAGMALSHTVARAVWQGLLTSGLAFYRTPKLQNQPALIQGLAMAREELMLLVGLWAAAAMVLAQYTTLNFNAVMWAVMLGVQSLPYLAAVILALINVAAQAHANRSAEKALALSNTQAISHKA